MKPASVLLLLLSASVFVFGCARSRRSDAHAAATENFYTVTSESAAFYRFGPQQVNGPDRTLPRETVVTVSRRSFGYARVRLTTGEQGYVSLDDIRPAPASAIAKTNPTPTPAPLKYPEPNLPAPEATPAVEPSAIAAPSASP